MKQRFFSFLKYGLVAVVVYICTFLVFHQSNSELDEPLSQIENVDSIMQESLYDLGVRYYYGYEVEQSYDKAKEFFQKASEEGNNDAQYRLGSMYFTGGGEPQYYLLTEYTLGLTGNLIGKGMKKDYSQAKKWLELSAYNGNSEAYNNLGIIYYHGYGVMPSLQKAEEMFLASIDLNNRNALENLAYLYVYEGAIQSPTDAKKFVTKVVMEIFKRETPSTIAKYLMEIDEIFNEEANISQYSDTIPIDIVQIAQQLYVSKQYRKQRDFLLNFVDNTKLRYISGKIMQDRINDEHKNMDRETRKKSVDSAYQSRKQLSRII